MSDFPYKITGIIDIPAISEIIPFDTPLPFAETRKLNNDAAKPFFLPPVSKSDPAQYRSAVKEAVEIKPIIDGSNVFEDLEKEIKKANTSVLIAFWAFDPRLELVTDSTKTWLDLLLEKSSQGVKVRIFMTDFDPGFTTTFHYKVWNRYFLMVDMAKNKSIPTDMFQVVVSHHEAEVSEKFIGVFKPGVYDKVADKINKGSAKGRMDDFINCPGLWDKLKYISSTNKFEPKIKNKPYPAWIAVHHQKVVIIDGKYAYTGGLNICTEYLDTREHKKPKLPWHDVFVRVEGSLLLRVFIENYMWLWNQERTRGEAFIKNAYKSINISIPIRIRITTDLQKEDVPIICNNNPKAKIPSQIHRTITKFTTTKSPLVPEIVRKDILEGYLQAISQAEKYIYIENQYFREQEIGKAIIQQHKKKSRLQTIILLPSTAEELLRGNTDPISEYGAHLQYSILYEMENKIGNNLGLFALERKDATLVYVHSKILIIDDKFASIGSANCNPRSFKLDTELDFVWYDQSCADLRINLWNEILGKPKELQNWKPSEFISNWEKASNEILSGKREGFAVPFENIYEGKIGFLNLSPYT